MKLKNRDPEYDFSAEVLCLISKQWTPLSLMAMDLFTSQSDVLASIIWTRSMNRKMVLHLHNHGGEMYVRCHPAAYEYVVAASQGYWQRVYGKAVAA